MNDTSRYLLFKKKRHTCFFNWRVVIGIVLFTCISPAAGNSQLIDNLNYTEISVTLNVARLGSMEMPVVIHGPDVYLPVKDIFDFLRIRNIQSPDLDSLSGFFINPRVTYLIDKMNNRIRYDDHVFQLSPGDLIRTETTLYLKPDYFREVFGLDCAFNFRTLSVSLKTTIELPVIREMQQEAMRRNISQVKGEKKADTTVMRRFSMLHLGTADWSVITRQQTNAKMSTGVNVNVGAIIAGGETNLSFNYNSDRPFNAKQQYYNWRYVNNDHAALRQVTAGKIWTQSAFSIYAPVTGVQFTNTPTTYRKSFGTYRLNSTTEPGWMVELYVNNILVNYTKADASGFFTFEVPLVYGNTVVKLRVYGPWGEERYREQNISIPFNFLPVHQFEYNMTAGIVDDDQKSRFSRGVFNYGLSRRMTIGGGVEYLSSVTPGKTMPFLNASLRLGTNLLITGEHVYGVRSKGLVSYRLPGSLQIDINYTRYDPKQTAIKYNYLEERKIVLSVPFHGKNFNAFSRLTVTQFKLPETKYTSAEFLVSGVVAGISSNLTTYGIFADPARPFIYSNLSQTFRLPAGLRVIPQVQYEYARNRFSTIRCELEKTIFTNGLLNLSFQKDLSTHTSYTGIGIRYNFSFAQTSVFATRSNHTTAMIQSARGSLIYDGKTKYLGVYNQSSIGKGGVIIAPYLDLNCNGSREPDEPKAFGLNIHINGGRIERNDKDTSIRITGLEAYNSYFIELDKNSFENVAWQIRKKTIRVIIDPDYLKRIEVPVAVVGEASGTVSLDEDKGSAGLERIIVNFYKNDTILIARTLTEADGYFSFLGFAPGTYTASIDTAQLRNLNFLSSPKTLAFTVKANMEGAIVDGLEFRLRSLLKTSKPEPGIQKHEMPALVTGTQLPAVENKPDSLNKDQERLIGKKPPVTGKLQNETPLNSLKKQDTLNKVQEHFIPGKLPVTGTQLPAIANKPDSLNKGPERFIGKKAPVTGNTGPHKLQSETPLNRLKKQDTLNKVQEHFIPGKLPVPGTQLPAIANKPDSLNKGPERFIGKKAPVTRNTGPHKLQSETPLNRLKKQDTLTKVQEHSIPGKAPVTVKVPSRILKNKQRPGIPKKQDSLSKKQEPIIVKRLPFPKGKPGTNKPTLVTERQKPGTKKTEGALGKKAEHIITKQTDSNRDTPIRSMQNKRQLVRKQQERIHTREQDSVIEKQQIIIQLQQFIIKEQYILIQKVGPTVKNIQPSGDKKQPAIIIRQQQLLIE
ncbi:MAG: hypothetical protein JWM28_4331, partial [Chitinophagaceae bacterium]|nr:hypothetical protein [Chitinophagaceae bacterium]